MKKSNRISLSLFDEELKDLINASTKIFPMTENDIINNLNPNNYEYGRVENRIYRWTRDKWEYIVADDIDINWDDIKYKPTSYPPSTHNHTELHSHSNKSILDSITQVLINTWNTVTNKADKTYVDTELGKKSNTIHNHDTLYSKLEHTHDYANTIHNHDEDYYKKIEVDTKLSVKSDSTHNHDGAYYKKGEVDTKLSGKAEKIHTHDYSPITHDHDTSYAVKATEGMVENHEQRLFNIENGYTEGHSHPDITLLNSITQVLVNGWNSAVTHISDSIKHITSTERTLWNTVSNKSDINHNHDVDYYKKLDIDTKLSTKSDTNHTHNYSPTGHLHDDRYYTESEIDTKMASKADGTTLSGHIGNATVHVTQTDKNSWNGKAELTDIPTSLPANGGNADTVGGFTVGVNVPSNANFSNTTYSEITTAEIDAGTTSTARTITGRRVKYIIDKIMVSIPPPSPSYKVGIAKPTDGSLWIDTN